jgi:hypothetical protein
MLLTKHNVSPEDCPLEGETTDAAESYVFCKKTCFNRWLASQKQAAKAGAAAVKVALPTKKRKTPWEDDGTLDCLMEWMTTEDNYVEYCGGNGNKGKTKTQHHKEEMLMIKDKVPTSNRTEKNC